MAIGRVRLQEGGERAFYKKKRCREGWEEQKGRERLERGRRGERERERYFIVLFYES